jgi:ribokinase
MVGRVGEDDAGRQLRAALAAEGVDVSHVTVTNDAPTGVAMISVDPEGENAIIVSPGANARLSAGDVDAAGRLLDEADAVLLQLEIPLDAVQETLQRAGGRTVLNPAPARRLPDDVLALVDVLVPNRGELGALLEAPEPAAVAEVSELAGRLRGPRVTVVTLGAEGALLIEGGRAIHVPGMEVEVVDTTAAGDCFCAALADALVRGGSAEDAVGWAVAAGALATTRPGAQGAMPSAREVHALLG